VSQAKFIPFYQPFMIASTAKRVTRYLSVVLRWFLVLGGAFALTVLAGLSLIDVLPKVYKGTAMIQLPPGDLVTPTAPGSMLEPEPFQPEFENTMMSPEFLLAVVKDLGLDKEWAKRLYKSDQDQLPDVDALTHMEKLLKIDVKRGTHVVQITAESDVPQEAADIANAVAQRYKVTRVDTGTGASPVRIIERAETPTEPARPNRSIDFIVTLVVAALVSVTAASFVEIVFLFMRAGERTEG
jgi:uncharacterized protein involved in exopolysaccharide biosynthesis